MDGRTTDPSPDPQSVLLELIRQAEANSSSTHQVSHPQGAELTSDDEDSNREEGDEDAHDESSRSSTADEASVNEPAGQTDTSPSLPSALYDGSQQLLTYEQISAALSFLAADRKELKMLLRQKKLLATAQKRNVSHQHSLERSLDLLLRTRDELKSALSSLDVADIVDAEDQSLEVIRTHRLSEDAAAACPFPSSMVQQIPLLRLQSIERAEYDNALGSRLWMESEDQQLRAAVKAAALKAYTVSLSKDPTFRGDVLAEAAKLDEEAALRLAEQIELQQQPSSSSGYGPNAIKGLDWATIAARMPSRSVEEIRTRWNGVVRPSVNTRPWKKEEVEQVIRLATPHLAAYLTGTQSRNPSTSSSSAPTSSSQAPIPWRHIAQQVGNGRTAYSCFMTFCTNIVQRDQPDMSSAEDDKIKELFSLFRGAWRFIALHNNSSPNISTSAVPSFSAPTATSKPADDRPTTLLGKVGREPRSVYRRYRNTIDPALATGSWLLQEDVLLIDSVRILGQDNWTAVAARVPGRTSSQCRERFNRRLIPFVNDLASGQGSVDPEQIAQVLGSRSRISWTKEMDQILLSFLDDDLRKCKDGRTFASVATIVAEKTGMALSDKTVRDRVAILRRNKIGKGSGQAEKPVGGESLEPAASGSGKRPLADDRSAADSTQLDTPAAKRTQQDVSKDGARARTAIIPGAKRRKQ